MGWPRVLVLGCGTLSFRALRVAKAHTPEMVNELAALAESTTDPVSKAKLLGSFNGLTEPGLMLPLVNLAPFRFAPLKLISREHSSNSMSSKLSPAREPTM